MKQLDALDARLQANVAALNERFDALESDLSELATHIGARLFALEAKSGAQDMEDDYAYEEDFDWPQAQEIQERINEAIERLERTKYGEYEGNQRNLNDEVNHLVDDEGYQFFTDLNPHGLQLLTKASQGVVVDGDALTFGKVGRGMGTVDPRALGEDYYRRHIESQWTVAGYSLVDFKERGLAWFDMVRVV